MKSHLLTLVDSDSVYLNRYLKIITQYKQTPYCGPDLEVHHIIPKSTSIPKGILDSKENLVKLPARAHFICHKMLSKITFLSEAVNFKLKYAFAAMAFKQGLRKHLPGRSYRVTSREYAIAKAFLKEYLSKFSYAKTTKGRTEQSLRQRAKWQDPEYRKHMAYVLSRARKGKPLSEQHKENIAKSKKGKKKTVTEKAVAAQKATVDRMKQKLTCEVCGKQANYLNYSKYHGSKCGVTRAKKKWYVNTITQETALLEPHTVDLTVWSAGRKIKEKF